MLDRLTISKGDWLLAAGNYPPAVCGQLTAVAHEATAGDQPIALVSQLALPYGAGARECSIFSFPYLNDSPESVGSVYMCCVMIIF